VRIWVKVKFKDFWPLFLPKKCVSSVINGKSTRNLGKIKKRVNDNYGKLEILSLFGGPPTKVYRTKILYINLNI
jgi:hypothetical protein